MHLAKIENDRIVPGSKDKIPLKESDTYSIPPYVLHSCEAQEQGLIYLNIAHEIHGLPVEEETHRRAVDVFFPFE